MIRVISCAGTCDGGGTSETRVEGFSGTLAGLLRRLEERSGISPLNFSQDKDADPLSTLIFMINNRHVAHVGGLDAPVSDGDTVTIFPMVAGG